MVVGEPPEDLSAATLAWAERWLDPDTDLLWNPPGSFGSEAADRSVHLLPQSAWVAFGLLERGGADDVARANRVLAALLEHQYDRPGTVWHGTFSRFAESSEPTPARSVEWEHYDPNWRQFLGTTFLLCLRHHAWALDDVAGIERALRLAVEGEPAGRVTEHYTNIALMKALLEVEAGERLGEPDWVTRGHELAEAVLRRFERNLSFDEFNSPTYYGIDLLGLRLWRTTGASDRLVEWGRRMERALWDDVARFWHPSLGGRGNLVGPFSRTYGMDMGRYVAALSLWMWAGLGRDAAPLPDLAAPSIDHGHDFCLGPVVARLGTDIPEGAANDLRGGATVPRLVRRPITRRRVATAWLGDGVAIGAEAQTAGLLAVHQYRPAMIQWNLPDGAGVAGLWLTAPLLLSAEARARELVVTARLPDGARTEGTVDVAVVLDLAGLEPGAATATSWELRGLTIAVDGLDGAPWSGFAAFGSLAIGAFTCDRAAAPLRFVLRV